MFYYKKFKEKISQEVVKHHDILYSPYVVIHDGKTQAALKIDELSYDQGQLIIKGWVASVDGGFVIELLQCDSPLVFKIAQEGRADVVESMTRANPALQSQGFNIQARLSADSMRNVSLTWRIKANAPPLRFELPSAASLAAAESHAKLECAALADTGVGPFAQAVWIKPDRLKANAHIDRFGVIPDRKGLLSGWVVAQSGWEAWVQDESGNTEKLDGALRYQREDVVTLFRNQFGPYTVDAGFVMQWPYPMRLSESIRILAYQPATRQAFELFKKVPEEVPNDPEGYARWAFTIPTPAEKFHERLNRWEGRFIETLLGERQGWFDVHCRAPEVQVLGTPPDAPTISLIIPLYARWDFIEHQLLSFARDRRLLDTTEIIYVVDDPRILTAISNEVENLYRMYEVPFKVVWGHRNRGFSGANNLGVSISRGRQVLLLNSDAFPMGPGWANRLSDLLDANPEFGLLGARLLNPEGGMQHAGMVFFYSSSWQVWLNKHPLAGLAPDLDNVPSGVEVVDKPAVTGACVIMTRALFDELGGLDEGYLIGDFEDSDLCLKVIEHGLSIGYVPGVELVHLERQSFSALGDTSFRTLVVRFNAWRHTQRWSAQIETVMKAFS